MLDDRTSHENRGIDRWLGIWYCTAPKCSLVDGMCNVGLTPEGDGLYFTNELGNTAVGNAENGGFRIPQWGDLLVTISGSGKGAKLTFCNET